MIDIEKFIINKNDSFFDDFVEIYNHSFTIEEEREDPLKWKHSSENNVPLVQVVFAIDNNKVAGGMVIEYYSKSRIGLLTYIMTDKNLRGQNIGSTLFSKIEEILSDMSNGNCKGFVLEIEDPSKFSGDKKLETLKRKKFFNTLGAKKINIEYYQPSLSPNSEGCDHLILMSKTSFSNKELLDFMNEFYDAHGCSNSDLKAQKCLKSIK